jgi:hypothetical protein
VALIRNERTKLLANALDRASTVCFTVGIATPAAGLLYNIGGFRAAAPVATLVLGIGLWLFAAVALHLLARRTLAGLRE